MASNFGYKEDYFFVSTMNSAMNSNLYSECHISYCDFFITFTPLIVMHTCSDLGYSRPHSAFLIS